MASLPERIMEYAESKPEATPIQSRDLLHLGERAAVNRALSRLVRSKRLLRVCRGLYMRRIQTRFGLRPPFLELALKSLSELWGETIVPGLGSAANVLGLTTQNPIRSIYLTSGPDRILHFGAHRVEFKHAPAWQLAAPRRTAGMVIRAVAGLGRNEVEVTLDAALPKLSSEELTELASFCDALPDWISEPLGRRLEHG